MNKTIPLIRILNPHLCILAVPSDLPFQPWKKLARFTMDYLVRLFQTESIFRSLPTDLSSCNTISEMIPLILKTYSLECSLCKNMNRFLRSIIY
jgi:hypothetical protein